MIDQTQIDDIDRNLRIEAGSQLMPNHAARTGAAIGTSWTALTLQRRASPIASPSMPSMRTMYPRSVITV